MSYIPRQADAVNPESFIFRTAGTGNFLFLIWMSLFAALPFRGNHFRRQQRRSRWGIQLLVMVQFDNFASRQVAGRLLRKSHH